MIGGMIMMHTVKDIREYFANEYSSGRIVKDGHGNEVVELVAASFLADEPTIFAEINQNYVDAEFDWYISESLNINDIYRGDRPPPKAWVAAADKHGNINSNYGHLIYSDKYYCQYMRVLNELLFNPDSRRASMIYTRPSIWMEYNEGGKSDFICTNSVTYYRRGNKLNAVVQMRSNDVVYGYRNDFAWQKSILDALADELTGAEPGDIYWQVQNLHVYKKHFKYIEEYINESAKQ